MSSLITFVVPTKNSARTVAACVRSLLAQEGDVEVIVVDNSSTDDTRQLASDAGASIVVEGGPERSAQRNRGLSLASGEVVAFIDSDQILEPGVAQQLLEQFRDATIGAVVIPERSFGIGYFARCRALEKKLIEGDPHAEAARAFRVGVVRKLGGYNVDLHAFEDFDLHDRVAADGWRVGRTTSLIHHDEGHVQLVEVLRKKAYYGRALRGFAANLGLRATLPRMLRRLRPSALGEDPLAVPGLIVLKVLDLLGVATGAIRSSIAGAPFARKDTYTFRRSWAWPTVLTYTIPSIAVTAASFSWYERGAFVAYGDNGPAFRRGLAGSATEIWGYSITGAGSRVSDAPRLFEAVVYGLADMLGLSAPTAQHLFSAFWLIAAVVAVAFVVRQLLPSATFTAAFVALIAIGNPLVLTALPNPLVTTALTAICTIAGVLVRVGDGRRASIAVIAIVSLPLSFLGMNPAWLLTGIGGGALVGLGLTAVLNGRQGISRVFRFSARASLPIGVVHAWWIVPSFIALRGSEDVISAQTDVLAWAFTHASASVPRLLTFTAYWGWEDFYPWTEFFDRWPGSSLLWVFPLLALTSPFLPSLERNRRIATISIGLGLPMLFLAKGLHEPLAGVNLWIYKNVPGFWLFREPTNKLGLIAAALFVIAISTVIGELAPIVQTAPRVPRLAIATLAVGLLLATTFPLYNGSIARGAFGELPSARVRVPPAWQTLADQINSDPTPGKVLVLPTLPYYQMTTTWGFHGVADLPRELIARPVILELPGGYYRDPKTQPSLVRELERRLSSREYRGAARLLDSLGVTHVIVREDFGPQIIAPPVHERRRLVSALASIDLFGPPERHPGIATLFERIDPPSVIQSYSKSAIVSDGSADAMARYIPTLSAQMAVVNGQPTSRSQRIELERPSDSDERRVRAVSVRNLTRVSNCNTAGGHSGLALSRLGSTGVRLRARRGSACTTVALPKLLPDQSYRLTFDQRTLRGAPARVCVWLTKTSECGNQSETPKVNRKFQRAFAEFKTPHGGSTARVFMYADGLTVGDTVTEYRDLKVERVIPYVVSASTKLSRAPIDVQVLELGRDRIRFRVHDRGSHILAMTDAADRGWRIQLPPTSEAKSILVDGYRQGWLVRGTQPFVGSIVFEPARPVRWAQAAALAAIAVALSLIAYRFVPRRKVSNPAKQSS